MWSQRNLLQQWSCALFYSMCLFFCWVMICPVTTCRPTQTQGHTHHDTVESVWLGSRSTCKGEEGKTLNVTDVFVLIAALLPLSLRLSIHHQPRFSLSVTSPSLSICRYNYSPLLLTYLSVGCLTALPLSHAKHACFIWNCTKLASIHNLMGVPAKCKNKLDNLLVF